MAGPSATRESLGWLVAQFPDIHMTIEALVAEGDTVAVRTLTEGANLGKPNGVMPPTVDDSWPGRVIGSEW